MVDSKFRAGDKVWSPQFGEGVVSIVLDSNNTYPVQVLFGTDQTRRTEGYTHDGRHFYADKPTLFFAGSYIVEAPEPDRRYHPEKGDVVAVSNDMVRWVCGVYSHMTGDGSYVVFESNSDIGGVFGPCYKHCEPVHKHFNIPDKDA